MYQNPWILQDLIRQQQHRVVRVAPPARIDRTRPAPRCPRARRVLAEVRALAVSKPPVRSSPPAGPMQDALDRAA